MRYEGGRTQNASEVSLSELKEDFNGMLCEYVDSFR